jgi:hypothetical protein
MTRQIRRRFLVSENEQPADSGAAAPDERDGSAEPVTASASPTAGGPRSRSGGARRLGSALTSRVAGWVVAAALAGAIVAVSVTGLTTPSVTGFITPSAAQITVHGPLGASRQILAGPRRAQVRVIAPAGPVLVMPGQVVPGGPLSGVLVAPFGQVVAGTVSGVSSAGFTITTRSGQKLAVVEERTTTYRKAGRAASESAVTRGVTVAVLGSLNGSKITASVVAVYPAGIFLSPPG